MRPQRAAAVSASAAIAVLSAHTADDDEGAHDTSSRGRKRPLKSVDDDDYQLRVVCTGTKKRAKASVLDNTPGPVVHYDSATLCGLPAELKYEILRHLDPSPFTILNLLLVSKVWYATLTMGDHADRDWQRRCHLMGATRRSPGCKAWKESFLYLLHRRCANCFCETTAKLGTLFDEGYRFLVVCERCQKIPGPFQVLPTYACTSIYAIPSERLSLIKHKIRKEGFRHWITEYLASTITKLAETVKVEREERLAYLVGQVDKGDGPLLIEVLDHVKKGLSRSLRISQIADKILDLKYQEPVNDCKLLVGRWSIQKAAVEAVQSAFLSHELEFNPSIPHLLYSKGAIGYTSWLDDLICEKVTVTDYVAAAVADKQKQLEAVRARLGSDCPSCVRCSNPRAKACPHACCGKCCLGPCERHSKK